MEQEIQKFQKTPMMEFIELLLKDDKIDIDTARLFLAKEKVAFKEAWMDNVQEASEEEKITGAEIYYVETYGKHEFIGTPRSEAIDVLNDLFNAKGEDVDFLDADSTKAVGVVTINKILFVLEKQIIEDFENKEKYIQFWRDALNEFDTI
jgi:hypothetical protein